MSHGFWGKLKKPIMALAPMADVTDAAFRKIIAKYGKPDVSFTEFTSADGLCSPEGRTALMHNLWYTEGERPIVAQLFSGKPEKMYEASKLIKELGFDGLDINMGCPDRSIEKSGAGAALIKNPKLAREIIRAAKEGASSYSPLLRGALPSPACADASAGRSAGGMSTTPVASECVTPYRSCTPFASEDGHSRSCEAPSIRFSPFIKGDKSSGLADSATSFRKGGIHAVDTFPVSIKTRLGYNKDELETWLPELLAEEPAAVTIHARTRKEMSKVPARWDRVKRAVEIRDESFLSSPPFLRGRQERGLGSHKTLILGNGDVMSIAEAREKAAQTGADGIMLGRAIFGNPWLFAASYSPLLKGALPSPACADASAGRSAGGMSTTPIASECVTPFIKGELRHSLIKRLEVLLEHTKLFEELLGERKSFAIMRKHFKAYVTGWDGAKELRTKLMETENASEVEKIVNNYLKTLD